MSVASVGRPPESEYAPSFAPYVAQVPAGDILAFLDVQAGVVAATLAGLPESRASHRYAQGKWSVREVLGHVIDSERVFAYRALAFARGETAPLPAFDEDAYARGSNHDAIALVALVEEFEAVRRATLLLFRHLQPDGWLRTGVANGTPASVRAIAHIIAGHAQHHLHVLRDRYRIPLLA